MSGDDFKLYLTLFQFALDTAKFQTVSAQMFIGEIDQLKSINELRRRLDRMPDCEEKDSMLSQIERLEFEFDSRIAFEKLKPLLNKSQEDQAIFSKILEDFKKWQSGGTPPGDDPPPA